MGHRLESSFVVGRGFFGTTSRLTKGDLLRARERLSTIKETTSDTFKKLSARQLNQI
jgi:hypothetical protein